MKDPIWVLLCCLLIPLLVWRFRKYDILVGANQPGPWFAMIVGRMLSKPYVIYLAQALRILHPRQIDLENGIRIREGDARFISALTGIAGYLIDKADRLSVENADEVLTNGDHVADWIWSVYGVRSTVCSAGCHPIPDNQLSYEDRWTGKIAASGSGLTKPFILLTNRHSPMKRFEYALWALKSIVRDMPEISLIITGQETEYTTQLRYLAHGLDLGKSVKFVGLVTEDELNELYRNAAAYVYPSPEEDFGMGIIEAMSAGTPVVAWNNGGPTVTVQNNVTGYLVKPYDTEEFARKLLRLISNPQIAERMGREGHRRAKEKFSYEEHNRSLELALREALEAYSHKSNVDETPVSPTLWAED